MPGAGRRPSLLCWFAGASSITVNVDTATECCRIITFSYLDTFSRNRGGWNTDLSDSNLGSVILRLGVPTKETLASNMEFTGCPQGRRMFSENNRQVNAHLSKERRSDESRVGTAPEIEDTSLRVDPKSGVCSIYLCFLPVIP